jgi:hypothetical protein
VVTTVAVLAAVLWFVLPFMAARVLQYWAERASLISPQFVVRRVGLQQTELAQVQFTLDTGAGRVEVRLEQLQVNYLLNKLALDTIVIGRARLQWHQAPAKPAAHQLTPVIMPLKRLTVEQLDLEVETKLGRSGFAGKADINRREDGTLEAAFSDATQSAHLTLSPVGDNAKVIVTQVAGLKVLEFDAYGLDSAPIRGTLRAETKRLLEWLQTSPWVPEKVRSAVARSPALYGGLNRVGLKIEATAETAAGNDLGKVSARLIQQGKALLTANLRIPSKGAVGVDCRVAASVPVALDFTAPLLPVNIGEWQARAGNIEGSAKLYWQKGIWSGTADLRVTELAGTVSRFQIENAELTALVTDLRDAEVEISVQLPSVELMGGLEASDLRIRAKYYPGTLVLEQARTSLFGGVVEIAPTIIDLERQPIAVTLQVQEIELSRLLQSFKQEGLSGTGEISGELPLSITGDSLEVRDGKLTGAAPGVLRYRGPVADANNIAFKALTNLTYHRLNATVNYRPDGEYQIGLRLEGKNPELLEGHPLAFNLNVTGHLPELLRASLMSGDFNRSLLEQVKEKPTDGVMLNDKDHPEKPPQAERRKP